MKLPMTSTCSMESTLCGSVDMLENICQLGVGMEGNCKDVFMYMILSRPSTFQSPFFCPSL